MDIFVTGEKCKIHEGKKLFEQVRGNRREPLKYKLRNNSAYNVDLNMRANADLDLIKSGNTMKLTTNEVLRKIRSEILKLDDLILDCDIYDVTRRWDMEKLEKDSKYIYSVSLPLVITLLRRSQLELILKYGPLKIYLDATGSLVKKPKCHPEHYCNKILYYACVVKIGTTIVPVAEMISCKHDTRTISHFLLDFKGEMAEIPKLNFPLIYVVDWTWAYIQAILSIFNNMNVIEYINYTFNVMNTSKEPVAARYCEGGHLCSPPKECCAQGCCYLYAPPTVPRTTPPPSDHVLNLFFINHWYFWCVVLAIILALLCACSLWKRRRQLCNWDINLPSSQSEGDSAGSCYAPPQYSRCSSFHHAPPPYTEVTSKPDLYPIVFTCNGDGIKNGASYLMVQYFRNYIVRPVGSLSAASTVDSLSSSFICTVNDSNTLVPPPYSRAASPEPQNNENMGGCSIPRSASHQICFTDMNCFQFNSSPFGTATLNNNNSNNNNNSSSRNKNRNSMRMSESVNFSNINNTNCIFNNNSNSVILSRSDQEFRYNIINTNTHSNSSNNISNSQPNHNSETIQNLVKTNNNISSSSTNNSSHNVTNNNSTKYNNNSNNNINNNQIECTNNGLIKNVSYNSFGCVSLNQPITSSSSGMERHNHRGGIGGENDHMDNQNHHHHHNNHTTIPSASFNSEDSPINTDYVKKFECIRSLVNSNTGSAVSSLANIDSPSSPPRATSPTAEVKELLEQINKLQINNVVDFDTIENIESINSLSSCSNNMNINTNSHNSNNNINNNSNRNINNNNTNSIHSSSSIIKLKRPSTLQTKKKFFSKTNKGLYTPIQNESSKSKNFVGSSSILCTGRGRRSWISRSAPTTPGSALPSNRIGDNSPLLNEHDEDNEQNV